MVRGYWTGQHSIDPGEPCRLGVCEGWIPREQMEVGDSWRRMDTARSYRKGGTLTQRRDLDPKQGPRARYKGIYLRNF